MAPRAIPLDDRPPRPWRNGGGTARDLLRLPPARGRDAGADDDAAAGGDDWRGQVSVAEVTRDGDFSAYPGVERWFAVLGGAGVDLTVDGTTTRLTRDSEPLRFDGAAATRAVLVDGPTRDLNLMLRGSRGRMARVEGGTAWRPDAAQCGLFAGRAGRCTCDGDALDVAASTLLWFDVAPAALAFTATDVAAAPSYWLAVTPGEAAP